MADLTAPPIRTALINNPDGSPFLQVNGSQGQLSTEKSWYYYWNNAGRQINANTVTLSQLVTHGTHADRPDASTVVDGALYVEHDRGVLYQNWNGSWRYIAGTMYGSLSPDQRPTDLGLADGGFEFRSVDADTHYAPKHFVWSQTAWIDATQVLYGTHATRPTADEKTPARTLYIETDRGSVIYQNQANVWTFCGGSMSNVLSARPTGLGAADVGFVFIATDTGQTFRWNGTAWVETTVSQTPWTSDIDAAGHVLNNAGKIGIGVVPVTPLDCAGVIRTTGGVSPTSGAGLEMSYQGGTCYLLGFNRTGGTYQQVSVLGLGVTLGANGGPIALTGGNVQIGSTSPVSPLHVTGAAAAPSISATAQIVTIQAGTGGNGQVLEIGAENASPWGTWFQGSYAGNPGFASPILFQIAGGNVGIGTANPTFSLQLGTDSAAKPGTSTWTVVSDLQLKQNVEPVKDDSLAILGKLDWIRYEYNGKANTPAGLKAIGLVAQELRVQLPEAVRSTKTKLAETDDAETDVLAIDYHHILVHSARAIAQLNAEVQALKALLAKPQ